MFYSEKNGGVVNYKVINSFSTFPIIKRDTVSCIGDTLLPNQ